MATGTVYKLRRALDAAEMAIDRGEYQNATGYIIEARELTYRDSHTSTRTSRKPAEPVTAYHVVRIMPLKDKRGESANEIALRFGLQTGGRVTEIWEGLYNDLLTPAERKKFGI